MGSLGPTTRQWPAPNISNFIAQLVGASHRYREVTRLNPLEVPTFSGFYIRNCINCFHNCGDHTLLECTSTVQYKKCFMYNSTFIPHWPLRTHNPQMTSSQHQWLHSSVGWSVTPVLQHHKFKPPWSPYFFLGFYIRNCINCFHNYEDYSFLKFTFAVQYIKYFT